MCTIVFDKFDVSIFYQQPFLALPLLVELGSLSDNFVSDVIFQTNSKHCSLHSSLSGFELVY